MFSKCVAVGHLFMRKTLNKCTKTLHSAKSGSLEDALSTEGRNFVKGLLNRNPRHRLGATGDAEELKAHAFFDDVDWDALTKKNVIPPFKPKLKSELDVSNFDPEFTNALNTGGSLNARAAALASGVDPASTPLSPTVQAKFAGFTFVDESAIEKQFADRTEEYESDEPPAERDDVDWEKVDKGHSHERCAKITGKRGRDFPRRVRRINQLID